MISPRRLAEIVEEIDKSSQLERESLLRALCTAAWPSAGALGG